MKARIINCSDGMLWYRDSIGKVIDFIYDRGELITRDNQGFINIVKEQDIEVLTNKQTNE